MVARVKTKHTKASMSGIEETFVKLDLSRQKAREMAKEALLDGAEEIKELSQEQAPYLEGVLTESHKVETTIDDGENFALEITYEAINETNGYNYGDFIHEGIYKLGAKSLRKMKANGRKVGNKFLERAAKMKESEIIKKVKEATQRAIRKVNE